MRGLVASSCSVGDSTHTVGFSVTLLVNTAARSVKGMASIGSLMTSLLRRYNLTHLANHTSSFNIVILVLFNASSGLSLMYQLVVNLKALFSFIRYLTRGPSVF